MFMIRSKSTIQSRKMQKCRRSSRSSRFSGNLELFGDSERKHEKEHISNGNGFIEEKSRITENFQ